jgi:hypothetical protein
MSVMFLVLRLQSLRLMRLMFLILNYVCVENLDIYVCVRYLCM